MMQCVCCAQGRCSASSACFKWHTALEPGLKQALCSGDAQEHSEQTKATAQSMLSCCYLLQAVGDIVVGSVLGPSSQRANECRIAMFLAGFPETVPVRTVNRWAGHTAQFLRCMNPASRPNRDGMRPGRLALTACHCAGLGSLHSTGVTHCLSSHWHFCRLGAV